MNYTKESEMFNQTADYYDMFRPSYPKEIIDEIIKKANLKEGSKLLEIGSGSGKATELFIDGGYDILCLDPGKDLVSKGNEKFSIYNNIKFECGRFEEYPVKENYYDLVFSAQAFHWISQPLGYEKCSYALKNNGSFAIFWNMYIMYDNDLDKELYEISNRYGGIADFLTEEGCNSRIDRIVKEIENSHLFGQIEVIKKPWKHTYTPDEYFGFMLTGNRFVQKSDKEKARAYQDINNLANKHGGKIERPYLCVLYFAKKI